MSTDKIEGKVLVARPSEKPATPGQVEVLKNNSLNEQGPEHGVEKSLNSINKGQEKKHLETVSKNETSSGSAGTNLSQAYYQARVKAIDDILSAGLHDIYLQMDPVKQKEFKQAGEETVLKIAGLLDKTKIKIDKVIDLIRRWLKIIPGINKFFLEQEAKIKADRIIKLKNN